MCLGTHYTIRKQLPRIHPVLLDLTSSRGNSVGPTPVTIETLNLECVCQSVCMLECVCWGEAQQNIPLSLICICVSFYLLKWWWRRDEKKNWNDVLLMRNLWLIPIIYFGTTRKNMCATQFNLSTCDYHSKVMLSRGTFFLCRLGWNYFSLDFSYPMLLTSYSYTHGLLLLFFMIIFSIDLTERTDRT